jgi:RND family efflux transporter, MFP subunit
MKQRKTLRNLLIIAGALILFVIIGKKAGWFGKEKPIEVTVEKVQKRTILETVTASGKIQPETEVKISPEVSGEIVELYVKEGDYVEKGKLLLKIKPDIYVSGRDRSEAALNSSQTSLANAKARLTQAEAGFDREKQSYERSKKLWEQQTISQADWEIAQSSYKSALAEVESAKQSVKGAEFGVKSAQATLKEANENLVKTTIYSPMSGTISKLNVEIGERVVGTSMMAGTELMRVANLDRMEVLADVNENDIVRVKLGDTSLVEVDAYLGQKFKAIVTEIANSATTTGSATDQVTNFEVKVLLLKESYQSLIGKNNPNPFRPGMSASLDIQTKKVSNVLSVPVQSVAAIKDSTDSIAKTAGSEGEKNFKMKEIVYVFKNGKANSRVVKTGIQDSYFIEIKEGLTMNDEVITGPYNILTKRLKEGMVVTKTEKNDLFKGKKK